MLGGHNLAAVGAWIRASKEEESDLDDPVNEGVPALKEWAAICKSLLAGEQIITLRKGGIREEGRRFSVPYESFALYPTFAHQDGALLKPAYARWVTDPPNPMASEIKGFCTVTEIFKIQSEEALAAIDSMHIWNRAYVLERLAWKPRQPLWVLALQAYLLEEPRSVAHRSEYEGCKSWIQLTENLELRGNPVLPQEVFDLKLDALRRAIRPYVLEDS